MLCGMFGLAIGDDMLRSGERCTFSFWLRLGLWFRSGRGLREGDRCEFLLCAVLG